MEPTVSNPEFFCNCSKHCGNPPKKVSRATYNRHAKNREAESFTPQFRDFLVQETQNPPLSSKRSHVRENGGSRKHMKKGKERETEELDDAAQAGLEDFVRYARQLHICYSLFLSSMTIHLLLYKLVEHPLPLIHCLLSISPALEL